VKTAGFFNDSDSLNKAIHLSDEAIALEPSKETRSFHRLVILLNCFGRNLSYRKTRVRA